MASQCCKNCRWYFWGQGKPPACYLRGKWQRWLKLKSVDKPNDCKEYKE